jgi:hypothetical protein
MGGAVESKGLKDGTLGLMAATVVGVASSPLRWYTVRHARSW